MKFLLALILPLLLHPIHITMTNIDINNKSNKIIVVTKFFSDDFQKIINKNYKINLNIKDSISVTKYKSEISNYIFKNLKVIIDKKLILKKNLTFNYTKSNFQAIWFYFEINKKIKPNKIIVINNLMNDLYEDQKNLVFIKYKNFESAFKLSLNETIKTVNITN